MKQFDTPTIRMTLLAFVVAVTLIGIYSGAGPYINSYLGRFFQADAVGQVNRVSYHADYINNAQATGDSSSDTLVCNLPDGWQIDRKNGRFWLTHYNPNGSVADSLPFDSLENFYQWFETHPDCCDVNIDKTTRDKSESEENDEQID